MRPVVLTQYEANDGSLWRSVHDAIARDTLVCQCDAVHSLLGPPPGPGSNPASVHSADTLRLFHRALIELSRTLLPEVRWGVMSLLGDEIRPGGPLHHLAAAQGGPFAALWERRARLLETGQEIPDPGASATRTAVTVLAPILLAYDVLIGDLVIEVMGLMAPGAFATRLEERGRLRRTRLVLLSDTVPPPATTPMALVQLIAASDALVSGLLWDLHFRLGGPSVITTHARRDALHTRAGQGMAACQLWVRCTTSPLPRCDELPHL